MTNQEQILGESDFQIISEKELLAMQNWNKNWKAEEDDIKKILKETGIYDELDDEEIKQKIDAL